MQPSVPVQSRRLFSVTNVQVQDAAGTTRCETTTMALEATQTCEIQHMGYGSRFLYFFSLDHNSVYFLLFISVASAHISLHILVGWDTALSKSWIAALVSEEPAALPSSCHGRSCKTPSAALASGQDECRGRCGSAGAALGSSSWQHRESNQTHSGFGRPTAGLGVFSAAPTPEERLGLETPVCPGGGSSPQNYWPGTGGCLRFECPPRP